MEIDRRLERAWPGAECSLDFRNPFELLIATILSAQSTDVRVNQVTPDLFRKYPDPQALASAPREDVEEAVRTTGFFRSKAKSIQGAAGVIVEEHGGKVPDIMEALVKLPGVGRKTANVVLSNAFHKPEGVVVDTHVTRVSKRLGLTRQTDAEKIEADLMKVLPRDRWTQFSHVMILHGRNICVARKPKCDQCPLEDLCPKVGVGKR